MRVGFRTQNETQFQSITVPDMDISPVLVSVVQGKDNNMDNKFLVWHIEGGLGKNIAATAIAGATTIAVPHVYGYPGSVQALVRAVSGGVEEQGLNYINLEYDDAGAKVPPRPNIPMMTTVNVSAGRTVTFSGMYDPTDELGVGTGVQLFSRTPNGTYDFTAPEGTFTLVVGDKKPVKSASVTYTYGADEYRYLTIKAVTAIGTLSTDYATEQLVYITNQAQSSPSLPSISLSRG